MEALQNGQTTSEGGIEGQSAVAASHAMIEKILSEEPRWQGECHWESVGLGVWFLWSACSCPKLFCSKYGLWSSLLTLWGFFADTTYVLGNYKTEQCKKPPRLCRQGYACPYYHNSKDRRRSPRKHKYRYCGPGYCTSQLSGAVYWRSGVKEAGFWPLGSCF